MLKQRYVKLTESIDALTLRERLFVFAAMLIVIIGAWEALLAVPLDAREAIASSKVDSARQRIAELDDSIALAANGIGDGMTDQAERLRVLRDRVTEGEDSVRIFTSDLVDPAQMRFVLEDLIRRQKGLRLVSAANVPGRPVVADEPTPARPPTATPPSQAPKLYRHSLVLVLEGSYLDCLAYLESVERLPWQLYWGSLAVEAKEYPLGRITLELHTLSLEEDWIGV